MREPHPRRPLLGLILALLITAGLLLPAPPRVFSVSASLSLSPPSGPAGATVRATGSGFQPGETVVLRWGTLTGTVLARPAADSSGGFTDAAFAVPSVAPGEHSVWAVGDTSVIYTVATFTVTSGVATPTPTETVAPSPTATATPQPTTTVAPSPSPVTTPLPTTTPTSTPAAGVVTLPGGPFPGAGAPVAVAVDPVRHRVFAVHRKVFHDLKVNNDLLPSDRVSVIDQDTGKVVSTIRIGAGLQGALQGIAVDTGRGRVYVANPDDNTLSIIDSASGAVAGTVAVGQGPLGVAADPAAGLVYVANSAGNSVTVLDAASGAVKGTVSLSGGAYAVAVDSSTHLAYVTVRAAPWTVVAIDGQTLTAQAQVPLPLRLNLTGIAVDPGTRVYVADRESGGVAVLDLSSSPPREVPGFSTGLYPDAVAVDTTTRRVYVAETGANQVSVFDSTGTRLQSTPVLRLPGAIAIDATARRVYVANAQSDSLSVLDTDRLDPAGTIVLGTANFGLAIDPATKRLYAANYPADAVSVLDTAGRTVIGSAVSGPGAWAVALDPDLGQVYVTNADDGTLSILSSTDGALKGKVSLGTGASSPMVAASASSHRVYATGGNGLTVLDGTTNQVLATVAVGSQPVGIAVHEATGRVYVASQQSGTITVIDAASNQVVATWQPPLNNVWGLAVDPDLGRLYVGIPPARLGDPSLVEVLDAGSGALIAQVTLNKIGTGLIAVNRKTHQIFATSSDVDVDGNRTEGLVSIIDGATNTIIATAAVGNSPALPAVDEGTGLVYVSNLRDGTISVIDPAQVTGSGSTPTVTPVPTQTPVSSPTAGPSATPPASPCPAQTPVAGAPAPAGPANCSALTTFQVPLQWTNPAGATQYELRILPFGFDGPALDLIRNVDGAAGSFTVLAPPAWYFLLPDMTYTWTLRTNALSTFIGPDDPRWGPWSPATVFRTPKASAASLSPASPPDGGSVTGRTPVLQWRESSPVTWYYEVQVSADPGFETDPARARAAVYWELRHGGATSPPNSYAIPAAYPLEAGTLYYWRVRPRVQGDGTPVTWSTTWSFRTP